ncbi:MAG: hypothetical protein LIO55_05390, partial [Oscillospiraceae bacterium]|nr:hypothetical protein [Oscillospiraceae bacterium]
LWAENFAAPKSEKYLWKIMAQSFGRIGGINNKIKTLRRKRYGYPDDIFSAVFGISAGEGERFLPPVLRLAYGSKQCLRSDGASVL